jgi:photosystem II stability/assembly factor-like uncharacterized protein
MVSLLTQPRLEPGRHQGVGSQSARFAALGALLASALIGCGRAAPAAAPRPAAPHPSASRARHVPRAPARSQTEPPRGQTGLLSATFVSPSEGWVLVGVSCGRAFCLQLQHTTDGGSAWTVVPSPQLASPAVAGQVRAVRFADSQDGWVYGSRLFATHDGGRSWRAVAVPGLGRPLAEVVTLTVLDGFADALVAEGLDPNIGGPSRLYVSDITRDDWRPVAGVGGSGNGGTLTSADGVGYASVTAESFAGDGAPIVTAGVDLFRSLDGRSWARLPTPPCATGILAAATSTVLYLVCPGREAAAGVQGKPVYRSDDGGDTWLPVSSAPLGGGLDGAAASPGTLLVAWYSGDAGIYASLDNGGHWASAYTSKIPADFGIIEMAMTTATQGYAIDSRSVLVMTHDAGRHWAVVRLAAEPARA